MSCFVPAARSDEHASISAVLVRTVTQQPVTAILLSLTVQPNTTLISACQ